MEESMMVAEAIKARDQLLMYMLDGVQECDILSFIRALRRVEYHPGYNVQYNPYTAVPISVMEAVVARDQLMKYVLTEVVPEKDIGGFMMHCRKVLPNKISFIDGMFLISVIQMLPGLNTKDSIAIYIRERYKYHCGYILDDCMKEYCTFRLDDNGRIVHLGYDGMYSFGYYNCPPIIARLDKLTSITLDGFQSIPMELSNLPNLEKLQCHSCSLGSEISNEFELNNLKYIYFSRCEFGTGMPFLKWVKHLPMLETLDFGHLQENEITDLLETLRTPGWMCKDKLEALYLTECCISDKRMETVWFDILPNFPNLTSLDVSCNNITSVKYIVDKIKSDRKCFVSNSLRIVNLASNSSDLDREDAELGFFLDTYNTICRLCLYHFDYFPTSAVNYALRINHAGRRIVESLKKHIEEKDNEFTFPESMWPNLLENAFQTSNRLGASITNSDGYDGDGDGDGFQVVKGKKKNPTGLYYLVHYYAKFILAPKRKLNTRGTGQG